MPRSLPVLLGGVLTVVAVTAGVMLTADNDPVPGPVSTPSTSATASPSAAKLPFPIFDPTTKHKQKSPHGVIFSQVTGPINNRECVVFGYDKGDFFEVSRFKMATTDKDHNPIMPLDCTSSTSFSPDYQKMLATVRFPRPTGGSRKGFGYYVNGGGFRDLTSHMREGTDGYLPAYDHRGNLVYWEDVNGARTLSFFNAEMKRYSPSLPSGFVRDTEFLGIGSTMTFLGPVPVDVKFTSDSRGTTAVSNKKGDVAAYLDSDRNFHVGPVYSDTRASLRTNPVFKLVGDTQKQDTRLNPELIVNDKTILATSGEQLVSLTIGDDGRLHAHNQFTASQESGMAGTKTGFVADENGVVYYGVINPLTLQGDINVTRLVKLDGGRSTIVAAFKTEQAMQGAAVLAYQP